MSLTQEQVDYMLAHGDESRASDVIAAATLGLVISITGVFLRVLARRRVNLKLKSDDWWIIVAVSIDVIMKATTYWAVALGFGKHTIFVTNPKEAAIIGLANEQLWILVTTPTKISVLCLYNRLFTSRSLFRWSLFIGLIVSAYSVAYGVALGLQTIPFRAQWTGEPAWNANINAMIGSVAALDVLTDIMIISSPVPQILKLKLDRQRKKELLAVFGVGAIVVIFGLVRTIFTSITPPDDPAYNAAKCEIWTLLQSSIAVFSACLPCLRPLLPAHLRGSRADSRPAYTSRNAKKRSTVDYEMFSYGNDSYGYGMDRGPKIEGGVGRGGVHDGIRVERGVQITYEPSARLGRNIQA